MSPLRRRTVTEDRAALIARSHACTNCLEYSFKKISVKAAPARHRRDLQVQWLVQRVCGVCGLEQEMGIAADGDVVYGG
jgi:hypothetical protein